MKRVLFSILMAGMILTVGLAVRRALQTDRAAGADALDAAPAFAAEPLMVEGTTQQPPNSTPKIAVSKAASAQPQDAVQMQVDPSGRFQPIDESRILHQRVTTVSKDRKKRELLVDSGGKYPYRRIEETLLKNEGEDTYTISVRAEMAAGHVLVKLQDGKTEDDLQLMLKSYGVSILRRLTLPGSYIVSLKAPTLNAVPEALSVFGAESNVLAYVEPDYFSRINAVPNDPRWGSLWGMVKINATGAWDRTTGSTNVVVAVIDTGIDLDHPDLTANLWRNSAEVSGVTETDDDGNGFIDDLNGWDFVNNDNLPDDDDQHGTHCAGTIGAVGNNAQGVAGVCWTVRLMALKALSPGSASGSSSDIAEAVQYAADNGADIISASYGGNSYSETERDSIRYAKGKGVLFVAAAGNDGLSNDSTPVYPAGYDEPNIVAVAATDQTDALASFSNYGKSSVDLAAPGVGIYSTVPGGEIASLQGTSMATPHVAGAAALLLSANPSFTHLQLKQTLLDTVDPVPALAEKTVSGGRLNVYRMLTLQDTDGDGMPDNWEIDNGLNPNNPSDAGLDPDGDGLSNLEEYLNQCDPHNADTDGDTLPDGWEVTYGFNPNSQTGGVARATALGRFNTEGSANNVVVSGDYAYVADGANGLVILNVSDPQRPVLTGWIDTADAKDVAVNGSYAYIADGTNGLVVINVSNPASPVKVGGRDTSGIATGIALRNQYAYVADGTHELIVFNVSNSASPQKAGQNVLLQQQMRDVFIQGDSAYVAAMANVFRMSLANPVAPVWSVAAPGGFPGWLMTGIHGNSFVIAAVAGQNGVELMNTNLIKMASFNTAGTASGVFVSGNYVYVADGANGLVVFDVSNPSSPFEVEQIPTAGSAVGVFVVGDKVYVASGTGGLEIFSVLPDSDGDGLLDSWEMEHFGNLSQGHHDDYDGDGISNWGEYLAGTDPAQPDTDGDGLTDYEEIWIHNTDPRIADTDGDGLSDGNEVLLHGTNPLHVDTDGDGMNDKWELDHGFDPLDFLNPGAAGDADSDGLTNLQESVYRTNPNNPDTDGDGMPDGWEVANNLNPLVNDFALDPDGDGLTNLQEYTLGTNPQNADTDGDGMPDGWEGSNGLNPLVNDAALDPDGDGLMNLHEYWYRTNPNNPDSDGDGMPDGWEVANNLNPLVNDAALDPDGDGLTNFQEYALGDAALWLTVYSSIPGAPASFSFGMPGPTNPRKADSDDDGLSDRYEITTGGSNLFITNPNNPDTDGDGFSDKWEVENGYNPLVAEAPTAIDRDNDGLTDAEEIALGTQPNNSLDPIWVDDDAPNDPWPLDPDVSDPLENGSKSNPFDSIQKAVDAASDGMTILVNDGLYLGKGNYNINTAGKALTIRSFSNAPDQAIVNSFGYGPVFMMNSGETTNTVLKGLGITVTLNDCSDGDCDYEHAIVLNGASPRIENCHIFDSQLTGVHCENNSRPIIVNTIISSVRNGIRCESGSSAYISGCTITNIGLRWAGSAGIGIYVDGGSGFHIGGDSVISNCNGRGIVLKDSMNAMIEDTDIFDCGGGVTINNSSPRIERCIIQNNHAPNYYTINGLEVISASTFPLGADGYEDITDEDENGAGILLLRGSSPLIRNCLITDNQTWADDPQYSSEKLRPDFGLGGGFYIGEGCSPTGINCTVANNHANTRGGGLSSSHSSFLRNMIFWGNTSSNAVIDEDVRLIDATTYPNLHCRSGSINIWYSNIQFGYSMAVLSTTNDPLFIGGGDYHLSSSNSPCYNKGTFHLAPLVDLDGRQRPDAFPDRVDMGCYEFGAPLPAPNAIAVPEAMSGGGAAPDPLLDTDGDGVTDVEELIAGTCPYTATDYFHVTHLQSQSDGTVLIAWKSIVGSQYTLQSTDSLTGTWVNELGYVGLDGTGGTMFFSGPLSSGLRYYRVWVYQH